MPANLSKQEDIAIVGLACRFAEADDTAGFWRNILENRASIGDHPDATAARVLDPASPRFDRLHTLRGGYLRELATFTPAAFGLDANALPGEGGAFFVLKRRGDAERNRDTIYAVIKGVGITAGDAASSTPTEPDKLVAAIRLAQAEADVDAETIGLVEMHGSAIPREDQAEIQALREIFADRTRAFPHIAIGSVKSSIGHCFAAAGAAGLAKATLALYHRILPPMITCRGRTHARLAQASSPFYVNAATRPWIEGGTHPRRAGVTAFDSACAHAHAVLEEHPSNR